MEVDVEAVPPAGRRLGGGQGDADPDAAPAPDEVEQPAPAAAQVEHAPSRADPDLLGHVLVLTALSLLEAQGEVTVVLRSAEVRELSQAEPEDAIDQRIVELEILAVGHGLERESERPSFTSIRAETLPTRTGSPSGSLQIAHDSPPDVRRFRPQRFHLSQRPGEIIYREVRQGEGVPRTTSARVEANRRNGGSRLPALTLSIGAALQRSAEQSAPEAQCTLGFVGRKLDQGQRQPLHAHNITPGGRGPPREGGIAGGGSAYAMQTVRPRGR